MSEQLDSDRISTSGHSLLVERDEFVGELLTHCEDRRLYSSFLFGRHEAHITLTENDIAVRMGGSAYRAYVELSRDIKRRQRIEEESEVVMGQLAGTEPDSARMLYAATPLFFEPLDHAMLMGERDDELEVIRLQTHDVEIKEQQEALLGGLAVLLWHLELE